MFRKTNISYPLIRIHMCAYQGIKTFSFSENFAYGQNTWFLDKIGQETSLSFHGQIVSHAPK